MVAALQNYQDAPDTKTTLDDDGAPENATVRSLYVGCGKCPNLHGPYLYWEKRDAEGKVRTGYIGKRSSQGIVKRSERRIEESRPLTQG